MDNIHKKNNTTIAMVVFFLGIFMGGFTAGAVGCSSALILGYIASLLSSSKIRK